MPSLRTLLKQPHLSLCVVAAIWLAAGIDMLRPPSKQVVADAYLGAVQIYQASISPRLTQCVRCRMSPTCSRYSAEAVERYGALEGLRLTASRLWRCDSQTTFGVPDPVP